MFNKIKNKLMRYTWDLAYGKFSGDVHENILGKLEYIKNPYKDKWFADPFILTVDKKYIHFLVEEYDYSVNRGRIARICVNRKSNTIVECKIILDLPTHLSFPVIYRIGNDVYVQPENSESGESNIYFYDLEKDLLVKHSCLIKEPLTDAIIKEELGVYTMYATTADNANGNILNKYQSNSFWGPYQKESSVEYPNNTARMAGMFLENKGRSIRPAQYCERDYGRAVILYDDHKEIQRIQPKSYKYAGIHTFNSFQRYFVIDLKKYDFPLFYKLIRLLRP